MIKTRFVLLKTKSYLAVPDKNHAVISLYQDLPSLRLPIVHIFGCDHRFCFKFEIFQNLNELNLKIFYKYRFKIARI